LYFVRQIKIIIYVKLESNFIDVIRAGSFYKNTVSITMAVFWAAAPPRLMYVYQRHRGPYGLRHQASADDSESTGHSIVVKLEPVHTALQPTRQPSS
jgi:hypothetical protein